MADQRGGWDPALTQSAVDSQAGGINTNYGGVTGGATSVINAAGGDTFTNSRGYRGAVGAFNQVFDPLGMFANQQVNGPDTNAYQMGDYWQQLYGAMAGKYDSRQLNPELEQALMNQALGRSPSPAEMQMYAGMQRAQASAQSLAASNPNVSPEMAQRMAQMGMSQAQLQTNQQAAIMRAQEMQQAQGLASQYTLGQQQLNDQMVQYFMSLGMSADQAQLQARIAEQDRAQQTALANAGLTQQDKGGKLGAAGAVVGALL